MPASSKYLLENDEYFFPKLHLDNDADKKQKVENFLDCFRIDTEKLSKLRNQFNEELRLGLERNPERPSVYPMINTFVTKFPTGKEVGNFLAIDIGGTNLRVIYLKLSCGDDGKYQKSIESENFDVPSDVRISHQKKFFGYLASCVKKMMDRMNIKPVESTRRIPLGFTFSFGFDQLAINEGKCFAFGIGTSLPDAVDKDPVKLFQDALDSLELPVEIVALANDATTALIYAVSIDPEATHGLILGSGTNVAYIEDFDKFGKFTDDAVKVFGYPVEKFVVNSEFPVFGDNGCMDYTKNKYDFELDKLSLCPGTYTYEKITGGAFLGELLRITMVDLAQNKLLFNGIVTESISKPASIGTVDMSLIESEWDAEQCRQDGKLYSKVQAIKLFNRLGYSSEQITDDDCHIVAYTTQLITTRGALFVAAVCSSFVDHSESDSVKIGCDGSTFSKHPKMSRMINSFLAELCPTKQTKVFSAQEGSGIGAAFLASVVVNNC